MTTDPVALAAQALAVALEARTRIELLERKVLAERLLWDDVLAQLSRREVKTRAWVEEHLALLRSYCDRLERAARERDRDEGDDWKAP